MYTNGEPAMYAGTMTAQGRRRFFLFYPDFERRAMHLTLEGMVTKKSAFQIAAEMWGYISRMRMINGTASDGRISAAC